MIETIHEILFIIGLFAIFFLSLIVNSGIIFGLYFASDYKDGEDVLTINLEIEKGEFYVIVDGLIHTRLKRSDRFTDYFQDIKIQQHSVISFDHSEDFKGNLKNYTRQTTVDEDSKQLLWFIKYYAKKWLGDYWCRPVICCPVCMASVHSLWLWLPVYVMTGFNLEKLLVHAAYMLCLVALNKYMMIKYEMD